jgi:mycothiol synthase
VDERVGTEIAGYRIESLIARGGMVEVYLATQSFPSVHRLAGSLSEKGRLIDAEAQRVGIHRRAHPERESRCSRRVREAARSCVTCRSAGQHTRWGRSGWEPKRSGVRVPLGPLAIVRRMTADLPDRFETRPAEEGDLDAVVHVVEAADRALGVPPDPIREDLTWIWHLPTTDLKRDTRIVLDGDTIVAYGGAIWKHPDEGGPLDLFVRVHPERRGARFGTWLLSWGETLAHERGSEGVRAWVADRDAPGHDLLASRGYVHVRSSFTMCKSLEPDEIPGTVPAGVRIRRYEDADERGLFEVNEASFADHWSFRPMSFENFNEELHGEDWDPSLVFLADTNGQTVGHVVAFLFETCGYVAMLGVLKDWRGRGIAKALLRRSFAELASRGMREVRASVDAQSAHGAVALYEGVGMAVCRRYDIFDLGTPEAAERISGMDGR